MIDCLKCINSACCKLSVEVDRDEYNTFWQLGLEEHFDTRTDIFLMNNSKYLKYIKQLDEMHKDNFAILKKRKDGNCILLDENLECSIYENRPKVCREYKQSSCINIRELKE